MEQHPKHLASVRPPCWLCTGTDAEHSHGTSALSAAGLAQQPEQRQLNPPQFGVLSPPAPGARRSSCSGGGIFTAQQKGQAFAVCHSPAWLSCRKQTSCWFKSRSRKGGAL